MTRKKVKLAYITNDSARKATFKKRKRGLLKKVEELSTLCDVEACAVIYSPYDAVPDVHPSPLGAQRVLSRFRRMPEMDQSKKMVNQDSFLRQRIAKAVDQLKKVRKDNREKEMTRLMLQGVAAVGSHGEHGTSAVLDGLSVVELNDMGWLIEQSIRDVSKKLEKVRDKARREADEMRVAAAEEERQAVVDASRAAAAAAGSSRFSGGVLQAPVRRVRSFRGRREAAAAEEAAAPAVPGFEAAPVPAGVNKHQWYMDLMMNQNQDHHDQMINLAFGDNSGQWGNGFFP